MDTRLPVVSMLMFVLFGLLVMSFKVEVSEAWSGGTIYIRSDGSVDPVGAPIQRNGDLFTLTDNIDSSSSTYGIVIERNGTILSGGGYCVQGTGYGVGIYLYGGSNVTIRNAIMKGFRHGIYLNSSSNNSISGNNITASSYEGISLYSSSNNSISGNNITNNHEGIWLYSSSNNSIFHNNLINNTQQVYICLCVGNVWDYGYPSGGNYWSDYRSRYPNASEIDASGIWDTPYVIDANNTDHYPLVNQYVIPEFTPLLILPLFMSTTLLAIVLSRRKRKKD